MILRFQWTKPRTDITAQYHLFSGHRVAEPGPYLTQLNSGVKPSTGEIHLDFEIAKPFIGEFATLLGRSAFVRHLGLEERPLLRLFLIECESNVSLLACLRLDDEDMEQSGKSSWKIAESLESSVLEAVLGTDDLASKAFKYLKKIPLLTSDAGAEADSQKQPDKDSDCSVSEKLRRLYVNSAAVKIAAKISLEVEDPFASGMRKIQFKTRLRNLDHVYREIAKSLRIHLEQDAA